MLNSIKIKFMPKKLLSAFIIVIICFGLVGGCGTNSADPDLSDPDKIVSNFLLSIIGDALFGNACQVGDIQIDSEAIPENTVVDIDFVPGFNTVGACILDGQVIIDSQGRANLDFIADYVVGIGTTRSFRILLTATTPDGQIITQFTDLAISGIGINPPTEDDSSTFTLDIPEDMMSLPFLVLPFTTVGIKPGTEVVFTLSDGALGSFDVNPAIVSGSVSSGAFITTYFAAFAFGTQTLTATITLDTPQSILDLCDEVAASVQISVIITIIQSLG